MEHKTLLATFILQLLLVAARAAQSGAGEACAEPGALRNEPSGALSVCVAGAERQHEWAPLGRDNMAAVSPRADPDCTGEIGHWVCSTDCLTLGLCTTSGWVPVQNCSVGEVCLNDDCLEQNSANQCPSDVVQCLVSGNYPDLHNCSQHYTCNAESGIGTGRPVSCNANFYDACLGDCVVTATEDCSWKESGSCVVGTYGVAPNNDRLYYFCIETSGINGPYPLWRDCGDTGHFDLTVNECVKAEEPGCGICEGDDDSNEDTTTTSTTTTTTGGQEICSGQEGPVANPDTDCSFYYCYPDGTYMLMNCNNGYHFANGGCVLGQCTE